MTEWLWDVVATCCTVVPRTAEGAQVAADQLSEAGHEEASLWLRGLDVHGRRNISRIWCHFNAFRRGWWRSLTGEWSRVEEMDDGHLLNSARMCLYGRAHGSGRDEIDGAKWIARHPVIVSEVVRRGLLLHVVRDAHRNKYLNEKLERPRWKPGPRRRPQPPWRFV